METPCLWLFFFVFERAFCHVWKVPGIFFNRLPGYYNHSCPLCPQRTCSSIFFSSLLISFTSSLRLITTSFTVALPPWGRGGFLFPSTTNTTINSSREVPSYTRQGCLIRDVRRVRRKIKIEEKTKSRLTPNRPPKPQQHGDRGQLETPHDEASPTRLALTRSRLQTPGCRHRPRRAFAIRQHCTQQTQTTQNRVIEASTHPAMKRLSCL